MYRKKNYQYWFYYRIEGNEQFRSNLMTFMKKLVSMNKSLNGTVYYNVVMNDVNKVVARNHRILLAHH